MNKKLTLTLAIAAALLTQPALADHNRRGNDDNARYDYAKVLSATPIYQQVSISEPRRECWVETVAYERAGSGSATPTLLGAVIGGAIGHAIGRHDRRSGTAIGAVVGGSIGHDIGKQSGHKRVEYRDEERCETRTETRYEDRLMGYDVTYKYHGETYNTRMDADPGKRLRVAVSVRPVF